MAYFEFPHTRNYDGDLGWVIKKIIELTDRYNDFFEYNSITFADPLQWDITKQYPPYQIVFDYDAGYSYISKKPVPAGVTITNPDYWCLVGPLIIDAEARTEITRILQFIANIYESSNVASAVRAAGEFVVTADGHLYKTTAVINIGEGYTEGINVVSYTVENMIHDLIYDDTNTRFTNIEGDITSLNGDISTLNSKIDNVKGYNNFTTRKVICISDSYGLTPDTANSWIGKLQTYLNIPNANFFRSQENASGFVGLVADTFYVQLQNVAGAMSADTKNEITDIIIGGGYNDATALRNGTTETTMKTAIITCLTYARTTFPNARIYVFMPGWNLSSGVHASLRMITHIYQQSIFNVDKVCYIDGIHWLHRQALLDSTNYHPNAIGAYCIAMSIASKMVGGDAFCDLAPAADSGFITPTFTADTSITGLATNKVKQLYYSDYAWMKWDLIRFTTVNAITWRSSVVIWEFTDGIMSGPDNYQEAYSAEVRIEWAGNTYTSTMLIYNNKLVLLNMTGVTIPAGAEISIRNGSIMGPIML